MAVRMKMSVRNENRCHFENTDKCFNNSNASKTVIRFKSESSSKATFKSASRVRSVSLLLSREDRLVLLSSPDLVSTPVSLWKSVFKMPSYGKDTLPFLYNKLYVCHTSLMNDLSK